MTLALLSDSALPNGGILLLLGLTFGFYMAWSIGANDVANALGTSVGSGALTLKQAVLIAAVMEVAGAVLVGAHVTDTVRSKMFDPSGLEPLTVVLGFLASLLAAAAWLQVATYYGWPVSTTHSIVGAVVGFGVVAGGPSAVNWGKVTEILISWCTSPLCGGLVAFALFKVIQLSMIRSKHPLRKTYRFIPFMVAYVAFVLALVMVWKGLKNLKLDFGLGRALVVSSLVALVAGLLSLLWVQRLRRRHAREREALQVEVGGDAPDALVAAEAGVGEGLAEPQSGRRALARGSDLTAKRWEARREFEFERVERVFSTLLVVSACFLAFAHGANDTANAIGPLAAIVAIVRDGNVTAQAGVPLWLLLLGGAGIVVGLATWGYKVIETIGTKITALTPSRAFAANIGAATTIVIASRLGFPISTTHTLVGAVLGVGLARGIDHLNLRVIRDIVISWLITVPAGSALAIAFYYILKAVLA